MLTIQPKGTITGDSFTEVQERAGNQKVKRPVDCRGDGCARSFGSKGENLSTAVPWMCKRFNPINSSSHCALSLLLSPRTTHT